MGKNTEINTMVTRKEFLPTTMNDRKTGGFGFINIWVGLAVIIATFSLGGEGVKHLTLGWVAIACLLANIALGLIIAVVGDIGTEHGIPFPVYIRVPFGPRGSYIPTLIRGLLGCVWFGIQTYFGAMAINYIVQYFLGFDSWLVWYFILLVVQVINAALGFKSIERFANLAAPAIIIVSIFIFFRINEAASVQGIDLWNTIVGENSNASRSFLSVFIMVFFANMAYWSTSASDAQNLTRYVKTDYNEKSWWKRNANSLKGSAIALPLTQTFMIILGGGALIALGNWNPVEAIQSTASGVVLILLLVLVVFAQWSTNTSANLLPPAMAFLNIGKKYFGYPVAVVLVGVIASVIQPWAIMERIMGLLNIMASVYSAIVGVTITDYYLLRKRRINIPDIYKVDGGQFYGYKGWNIAGIIALVLAIITANIFTDFGFLAGLVVSGVAYYFLAKYWWFKKYEQVEIVEGYDEKYLGTTVGKDWCIKPEE